MATKTVLETELLSATPLSPHNLAVMVPPLALDAATLIGIICLALLYGIFFPLFIGALYVLVYRRSTDRINRAFFFSSIGLFVLITSDLIIRWMRCYAAFISNGGTPGGSIAFLNALDDWREVSTTAIWVGTSALGDTMLIYRLYVVWDRRWIMAAFPLLLLLGSLTSGFGMVAVITLDIQTTTFATTLQGWVYSFLTLNLAQNVLVTSLIAIRIWSINMGAVMGTTNLWPVIVILLESGALYSLTLLVTLMTYVSQSNGAYVLTDMVVPIIGITFELIIVRVGLGISKSNRNMDTTSFSASGTNRNSQRFISNGHRTTPSIYPLQSMQVSRMHEETRELETEAERSKEDETGSQYNADKTWA